MTRLQRQRAKDLPVCCAEALERHCLDCHSGTHRCEYCGGLLTFQAGEWRCESVQEAALLSPDPSVPQEEEPPRLRIGPRPL